MNYGTRKATQLIAFHAWPAVNGRVYSSCKPSIRSRPQMTDYSCKIACVPCRKAGECLELGTASDSTGPGMFYPNREADTPLKCGCKIPWPIIQAFGQHIHGQVWCSVHGWQPKITAADLARSKKAAPKPKEDGELDLCPF